MESLKTVTGLLKTVIKASEAANAATESLSSTEEELVKFFNAMHQEVSELEKQSEDDKARIAELTSEVESYKTRITELEKQSEDDKARIAELTSEVESYKAPVFEPTSEHTKASSKKGKPTTRK